MPRLTHSAEDPRSHPRAYWYESSHAVPVLDAVRVFLRADEEMRRRLKHEMDMNETDLRAVRLLAAAELANQPVSPRDLSAGLGISSASTTKLLDRLENEGRLRREPHPSDRRGLRVVLTSTMHTEVRDSLGEMHQRMRAAADELSPHERDVVVRFLTTLAGAVLPPEKA